MTLAITIAALFIWLGMVLAISFMEAPLKFRAPGLSLQVGLGVGRIVFRALNAAEILLAVIVFLAGIIAFTGDNLGVAAAVWAAAPVLVLVVQLLLVRPRLNRRTDAVLAGHDAPRSRAHHAYIATEVLKVIALVTAGVFALGAGL